MNDLIRPAFYDAYHQIVPLTSGARPTISSDVVGGICESGDFFCKDRPCLKLWRRRSPRPAQRRRVWIRDGVHLHNTRPFAAEVLVNGKKFAAAQAAARLSPRPGPANKSSPQLK